MKFLAALPALFLAACTTPQYYADQSPKMDFISYFSGKTDGHGAIYDFRGRVTDTFHVAMVGTPGTNASGRRTLTLNEDFTYASGKTQKRSWDVTETASGKLEGKAADVPGLAEGTQAGNALQFHYPITITRENGKKITLSANDWMWMMPQQTLINRNTLSKFGIPVAELVITFTK
ncbi:MAG: DUF3833 family protein [Hyphomicrobiales bacterium]|nr:MAG: DUF3833 family protein [Hyphomicrobiales bacterium]